MVSYNIIYVYYMGRSPSSVYTVSPFDIVAYGFSSGLDMQEATGHSSMFWVARKFKCSDSMRVRQEK